MILPQDAQSAYAYLLGLYLGDGHLNRPVRSFQLRITLDSRYPEIVDAAAAALRLVSPHGRAHVRDRPRDHCTLVEAGWTGWPELFPQHGAGPKHKRPIRLAAWQQGLVQTYPEEFVCGLIDSDGCRTINRFKTQLPSGRVATYAYARYFFTNLSMDIKQLFCDACDLLGIRWTRSNARSISISDRRSVRKLDSFVGPKDAPA